MWQWLTDRREKINICPSLLISQATFIQTMTLRFQFLLFYYLMNRFLVFNKVTPYDLNKASSYDLNRSSAVHYYWNPIFLFFSEIQFKNERETYVSYIRHMMVSSIPKYNVKLWHTLPGYSWKEAMTQI